MPRSWCCVTSSECFAAKSPALGSSGLTGPSLRRSPGSNRGNDGRRSSSRRRRFSIGPPPRPTTLDLPPPSAGPPRAPGRDRRTHLPPGQGESQMGIPAHRRRPGKARRHRVEHERCNRPSPWVTQVARNFTADLEESERRFRFIIRDRDAKFTTSLDAVFAAISVESVRTLVRLPRANAFAERWVRAVRQEFLDHLLVLPAPPRVRTRRIRRPLQPGPSAPGPAARFTIAMPQHLELRRGSSPWRPRGDHPRVRPRCLSQDLLLASGSDATSPPLASPLYIWPRLFPPGTDSFGAGGDVGRLLRHDSPRSIVRRGPRHPVFGPLRLVREVRSSHLI